MKNKLIGILVYKDDVILDVLRWDFGPWPDVSLTTIFPDITHAIWQKDAIIVSSSLVTNGLIKDVLIVTSPIRFSDQIVSQVKIYDKSSMQQEKLVYLPSLGGSIDMDAILMDNVEAMCVHRLDGSILIVNAAFERMFDWTADEITHASTSFIPESLKEQWHDCLSLLQAGITMPSIETSRSRRDGRMLDVRLAMAPIMDDQAQLFAVLCFLRDITPIKRLEQNFSKSVAELRVAEKKLREKDKLSIVGTMAAGMAHEIRNPLTSIQGFVQLIADRLQDDPVLLRYVHIVIDEVKRANHLLVDFLQLSRMRPINVIESSLSEVVNDVVTSLEFIAKEKNVRVEVVVEGTQEAHRMLFDENQIKQVLHNIIKNAIEASFHAGIVTVIVGKDYLSHEGYVEVIDQGDGMKREDIDRLGIPFFSTKKGGTGLGLSVSYSIIQAHQGRIEVDSTVKKGTKFRICLPDKEKLQAMKTRQDADT